MGSTEKSERFDYVDKLGGYRLMAHIIKVSPAAENNPDHGRTIPLDEAMTSAGLYGEGFMPTDDAVLNRLAEFRAGCVGFVSDEWSPLPDHNGGFVQVRVTAEVVSEVWNDPFYGTLKAWARLVDEVADANSPQPVGEGAAERVVDAAEAYVDGLRQLVKLCSDGMDRWMLETAARGERGVSVPRYIDIAAGRAVELFAPTSLLDAETGRHALPRYVIGTMRRAGLALYPSKP